MVAGPERDVPLLVLVSGAPGAGKSTLASRLGTELRLPVIDKDRLREGRLCTTGGAPITAEDPSALSARWFLPGAFGPELWYRALETLLEAGVSAIGDMTLYRGVSEPEVAARLAPRSLLVNVHCVAGDGLDRFVQRTSADVVHRHIYGHATLDEVRRLQHELRDPLDLGCPQLVVDTSDGLRPDLAAITTFIVDTYADSRSTAT